MRPTTKQPGAVWALLEDWSSRHPLKPKQGQMAGMLGISTSLMSAWKHCESTIQPDDMEKIVRLTDISWEQLSEAVRTDLPRVQEFVASRRVKFVGGISAPTASFAAETEGGGAHAGSAAATKNADEARATNLDDLLEGLTLPQRRELEVSGLSPAALAIVAGLLREDSDFESAAAAAKLRIDEPGGQEAFTYLDRATRRAARKRPGRGPKGRREQDPD